MSVLLSDKADMLNWLLANAGEHRVACLLLGAADAHVHSREAADTELNLRARTEALHQAAQACAQTQIKQWLAEGARMSEGLLQDLVQPCLQPGQAPERR